MTQVVDADVLDAGAGANALPECLKVAQGFARQGTGDDPRVPLDALGVAQEVDGGLAEMNDLGAGLGVRQTPDLSNGWLDHAPDTCSRPMLQEFARLAQATGKQVHTHLAQSSLEVERIRAREGMTPVELLEDVGLLNADLVAAHCIFLTEGDIARLGRNRVVVAHAPVGNASFGAAAPIVALEQAGAQITLCTDTKCADMFEAMRMAIASARGRAGMEMVLEARTVFGWATTGGAAALKGHGASGTLAPGAPADLTLLDPEAPNLRPVIDGFGIVVHSGSAANVRAVICAGEVLVRDGRPTRVDPAEVIAEAQRVAEGLWQRARG